MHELSVTESILKTALEHAGKHGATKVVRITLAIGELTDMNEEWIQRYFDYVSKDTIAEGARIEISRTNAGFLCHTCSADFEVDLLSVEHIVCPSCGDANCTLERGREFYIDDMEVII